MSFFVNIFALQNTKSLDKYSQKNSNTPCVQAFLNAEPLNCGIFVSKKSKGIITVSKDGVNKIYFNVTFDLMFLLQNTFHSSKYN